MDTNSVLLIWAAIEGDASLVELLLQETDIINNVDVATGKGFTPLMCASGIGRLKIVKLLIENGADVNAENNDGKTALDLALENDHPKIAEFLREHGAKRGCDL